MNSDDKFHANLDTGMALLFRNCVEVVKDLIVSGNIVCSPEGLNISCMDPSHVALVNLNLPASMFSSYVCPREFLMGINFDSLSKGLKVMDQKDTLSLSATVGGDALGIVITRPGHEICKLQLNLIVIDEERMEPPDFDVDAHIVLDAAVLLRSMRHLTLFGEHVDFSADKETLAFSSTGDRGSGELSFGSGGGANVELDVAESVRLRFSTKYLLMFSKASTVSPRVSIEMTKTNPLRVTFPIPEGGSLAYYLAPTVTDDDSGSDDASGSDQDMA